MTTKTKSKVIKGKKGCRLGVTAKDKTLDSEIGSMGSSRYILIFEGSSDKLTILNNPAIGHGSKGGMMAADAMVSNGVNIVITGTIGSKAWNMLSEAGIKVHGGCTEKVRSAMEKCLCDELPECQGAVFAGYLGT